MEDGIAWDVFDDSLAICVIEKSHSSQVVIDNTVQNIVANWKKPKLIFRGLNRHMNRDLQILPITRFPLTLFPIDTSLGLKFVLGDLNAIVMLNIDVVQQKMKEAGLIISKDDDGVDLIKLPSGAKFSIVDGWEKILLELISVPSFIEYIVLSTQRIDSEIQNI